MNIHHIAIQTRDYDSAFQFYTQVFGLKVLIPTSEYKTRKLCFLNAGSIEIELYSCKEGDPHSMFNPQACGLHHIAFTVDNLDYEIDRLIKLGVKINKMPFVPNPNTDNPKPIAFIAGPDGQEIELKQI
jgi:catechol 2,3-dioxygenase-like lactoylglutathione lyase family enzyme